MVLFLLFLAENYVDFIFFPFFRILIWNFAYSFWTPLTTICSSPQPLDRKWAWKHQKKIFGCLDSENLCFCQIFFWFGGPSYNYTNHYQPHSVRKWRVLHHFCIKIEVFRTFTHEFLKNKVSSIETSFMVLPTTVPILINLTQTRSGMFCTIFASKWRFFAPGLWKINIL